MMLSEIDGDCGHMDTSALVFFIILTVLGSIALTWLIFFVGTRSRRREEARGLPAIVRRYHASEADDGARALRCSFVVINRIPYMCQVGIKLGKDATFIYDKGVFSTPMWGIIPGVAKIPLSHLHISYESTRWWMLRKVVINDIAGGNFVLITDIIRSDFDDLCDKIGRLRLPQSDGQPK